MGRLLNVDCRYIPKKLVDPDMNDLELDSTTGNNHNVEDKNVYYLENIE